MDAENNTTGTTKGEGNKQTDLPRLLDWRGACAALGGDRPISRATLDRLTKSGTLRVRRPASGVVRWALDDIVEYLNSVSFPRSGKVA